MDTMGEYLEGGQVLYKSLCILGYEFTRADTQPDAQEICITATPLRDDQGYPTLEGAIHSTSSGGVVIRWEVARHTCDRLIREATAHFMVNESPVAQDNRQRALPSLNRP